MVVENVAPKANAVDETVNFHFGDGINGASPQEADKSCTSTPPGDNVSISLQNICHHNNSSPNMTGEMFTGFGCGPSFPSIGSENDCAIVAMNLLQHLNIASRKESSLATPKGGIKAPTLDALMNTASMAIKRVSTILICPCSKKPDVGLLAAAVCAALLDTYEVVLRNSTRPKGVSSPTENNRGLQRSSMHSVTTDAEGMETCTEALRDNEKAAILRILEELPKVANLVTQYTRRYSHDTDNFPRDLPQTLAASITSRLKSMVDEVTNWVVQI